MGDTGEYDTIATIVWAGIGSVALIWAIALIVYDIKWMRLPNFLTIPAIVVAVAIALFAVSNTVSVLATSLIWPGLYLVQAMIGAWRQGSGIGGGDIKLAFPLAVASYLAGGMWAIVWSIGLANLLSVVTALLWRQRQVPHGPAMIVATVIVVGAFVE